MNKIIDVWFPQMWRCKDCNTQVIATAYEDNRIFCYCANKNCSHHVGEFVSGGGEPTFLKKMEE